MSKILRQSWTGQPAATLAVGAVALGLTAFSATAASAEGQLIGVIFPTQTHARVAFEVSILEEAIAANGDELIIQYSNESAATQATQFESMIERGVDVIIFQAIDAVAANALVEKAHAAGLSVITYDRGVTEVAVEAHISRDNYEMGTLQAQSALAAVPCGKYAIIRGDQATIAQIDMSRAYDELVVANDCIEVVHDVFVPGWETAAAQREAEAVLQSNPDINAFLVMWDTGAQAVVQALKSAGVEPGTVWVTGSDATPPSLAYIWESWQGQTTWTPIDQQARDAANVASALGAGLVPESEGKQVMVDGVLNIYPVLTSVTKDNLCEFINDISPEGWINPDDVFGAANNPCQ